MVVQFFDTRTLAQSATINTSTVKSIQTQGYAAVGDGGEALYKLVTAEPGHAGKVQSADGAWWELTIPPEGVNVKTHGAVGDGVADDGTAIKNAWNHAVKSRTFAQSGGLNEGALLYMPPGNYLITENNVFGQADWPGQLNRSAIRGAGWSATTLTFKPNTTSDNGFASDNKFFLYDGGNATTNNTLKLLLLHIKDMQIILNDDDLTTGDEIGVVRIYGDDGNQGFEFHSVHVLGPGTMTEGNVRSYFMESVGSKNGSECKWVTCRFRNMSHLVVNKNPQAVDYSFYECDPWLIHDHFFRCDNGALEIRIYGGSWIWPDNDDDIADVSPQYLLDVDSSGGLSPGAGNMTVTVIAMKPEMRHEGAALVSAEDLGGGIMINFADCNFAGGGITGNRNVTSLNANKVVNFNNCLIPSAFGFNFVCPVSQMGSTHWGVKSPGLVTLNNCAVTDSISERISKASPAGRVIARGCYELTGVVTQKGAPVDFDSNPFNCGPNGPTVESKWGVGVPSGQTWASGETFTFVLPYGARLLRIIAHRPASGGATSRTMTLADGDGTLATDTANENATGGLNIDHTPANSAGILKERTTNNERTLTLTAGTLTAGVSGAVWAVEYL